MLPFGWIAGSTAAIMAPDRVNGTVMNSGWFGGSVRNCSQSGAIGMLFKIADFVIQGVDSRTMT